MIQILCNCSSQMLDPSDHEAELTDTDHDTAATTAHFCTGATHADGGVDQFESC